MDTVTYPDENVARFVGDQFEAAKLHVGDKDPLVRDAVRRYRMLWAPGYVVLDGRGEELRRFIGFQPPRDWTAELRIGLGKAELLRRGYDQAFAHFRAAADLVPPAPVSDEGVYWAGIAVYYRDKKDLQFLHQYWEELVQRFPESRWWTAANVFEE
jgi:tetratricopeptide (TPR) repeat protein